MEKNLEMETVPILVSRYIPLSLEPGLQSKPASALEHAVYTIHQARQPHTHQPSRHRQQIVPQHVLQCRTRRQPNNCLYSLRPTSHDRYGIYILMFTHAALNTGARVSVCVCVYCCYLYCCFDQDFPGRRWWWWWVAGRGCC